MWGKDTYDTTDILKEDDEHVLISYNKRRVSAPDIYKLNIYTGKLELLPSPSQFGTLDIQPSQYNVKFKKSGYLTFYFLRGFLPIAAMFVMVSFVFIKIKKRMPIKV